MTGWPSALTVKASGFATKAAAVGQNLDAKLTKAADKLDKVCVCVCVCAHVNMHIYSHARAHTVS